MAMVRGIDGGLLINMLRAGREDGMAQRARQMAEQRAQERAGIMGRLYTGGDTGSAGGVAGQYAPSQPATKPSFDQAFGQDTMQAMETGQALPQLPQEQPAQMAPQRPAPARINRDVLNELLIFEPESAMPIIDGLAKMDETRLKTLAAKNDYMGAAARFIRQGATPQERMQRFGIARDQLLQVGWTEEELSAVDDDLSDQRLGFYEATAIDYDKMIDNALAEREFQAGKTVPVTAGGSVALIKPDGTARYVVGGDGGQGAEPPAEAIEALRAGQGTPEQFDEIFGPGAAARVMGGAGGNASGNFRP